MKVIFWGGHGAGHNAHVYVGRSDSEGSQNFRLQELCVKSAQRYEGFEAVGGRKSITDDPSLARRGELSRGFDLSIELHTNGFNGKSRGTEVLGNTNPADAFPELEEALATNVANLLGIPRRRTVRKKDGNGANWYGFMRGNYAKKSLMLESVFHDNSLDVAAYERNFNRLADVIVDTIAKAYGLKLKTNAPAPVGGGTMDDWTTKVRKSMVDNKIMSDGGWDKPITKDQLASILYTAQQKGYFAGIASTPAPVPKPTLKSIATIAKEVIDGKWGNGQDRINRLTKAGYDYNAIQQAVNSLLR